ncbi:MAG TPA: hypothetical protein PLX45_14125 [Piscinibacter sp.]|jgi:hypothetical protein|uniref:hypothetical protein n=1 Tax=Piscinibacter sp. TaxID=1903157 RepID=UPI001B71F6DB|nr:hypothetical protein [Piscinibacter sp.]MBK7529420.1 hypothetical protein [Piscinibacter sp.]MBL0092352.1 hypothetical protein [Piscinibacter sp.]MBP6544664.1 hypothetical protein [Piscinibacter sp.]HNW63918.1 hypothetical protein [Piscinibacter sp.]HOY36262.1 hypothetical protein [Piscinibacter sp.]
MSHDHAHPHDHGHAEPRPRDEGVAGSVLMSGALPRMAAALAALVLLWAAVAWALADLSA